MSRWLYHALVAAEDRGDPYAPASLASEGFVHASFATAVHETIALYLPPDDSLVIFQIDPRLLGVTIEVVETPRGPMPHLHGPIPRSAIAQRYTRTSLPTTLLDAI